MLNPGAPAAARTAPIRSSRGSTSVRRVVCQHDLEEPIDPGRLPSRGAIVQSREIESSSEVHHAPLPCGRRPRRSLQLR